MTRLEQIDSILLRRDRQRRFSSMEKLEAASHDGKHLSISLSNIRRAETQGTATLETLERIAKLLGLPPERYLVDVEREPSGTSSLFRATGRWLSFYIEDDVGTDPYQVTEHVDLHQRGSSVHGSISPKDTEHPLPYERSTEFDIEGEIMFDLFSGRFKARKSELPVGIGSFQLIMRNYESMDGFCLFYDDARKITMSPYVWVRLDAEHVEMHIAQAKDRLASMVDGYKSMNRL